MCGKHEKSIKSLISVIAATMPCINSAANQTAKIIKLDKTTRQR